MRMGPLNASKISQVLITAFTHILMPKASRGHTKYSSLSLYFSFAIWCDSYPTFSSPFPISLSVPHSLSTLKDFACHPNRKINKQTFKPLKYF